jgi:DNA-binding LacI/PurR family transcriptional regulator
MTDVARAAGVSPMTVSYAYSRPERVSADTAARVLQAAERLGYPGPHPTASSLRRGRADSLGVVLGEHLTYAFEDPQATRFLAGVAQVCAERAVGLTIVPVTGAATDTQRVRQAAVDGFVVWTTADDDPVLDAVAATGLPVVIHGGPARRRLPCVGIDDRAAGRAIGRVAFAGARRPAVLSFPLDRGRRPTVLLGPDPEIATYPVTRERLTGLRDAVHDLGADWSRVPVAVCAVNSADQGAEAAVGRLRPPAAVDALAAMSDELALGALLAAREAGVSVPDQLAVTGWDDTPAAGPAGLTTVRQDLREQGARCARIALGEADWSAADSRERWTIVRRQSSRA